MAVSSSGSQPQDPFMPPKIEVGVHVERDSKGHAISGKLVIGTGPNQQMLELRRGDDPISNIQQLYRLAEIFRKTCELNDTFLKEYTEAAQSADKDWQIVVEDESFKIVRHQNLPQPVPAEEEPVAGPKTEKEIALGREISSFKGQVEKQIGYKEQLKEFFLKSGYSKETIKAAIKEIWNEGHFVFADTIDRTVADMLQEPGNEGLRAALVDVEKELDQMNFGLWSQIKSQLPRMFLSVEKCTDKLLFWLTENSKITRNARFAVTDTGTYEQVVVRTEGKVDHRTGFLDPNNTAEENRDNMNKFLTGDNLLVNHGRTSAQDKKSKEQKVGDPAVPHNTNLASVTVRDGDKKQVLATRSGRSDNLARLQELTCFNMMQHIQAKDYRPFGDMTKDKLSFRLSLKTLQDLTTGKSKSAFFGVAEDERRYILRKAKALQEWPPKGYPMKQTFMIDGKPVDKIVMVLKPILDQELFSASVGGIQKPTGTIELGQEDSDRFNFIPNQQRLMTYITKFPAKIQEKESYEKLKQASIGLNTKLQKALGVEKNFLAEDGLIDFDEVPLHLLFEKESARASSWLPGTKELFFSTDEFKQYNSAVAELLLKRMQTTQVGSNEHDASKALYAVMYRRIPPQRGTPEFLDLLKNIQNFSFKPSPEEEIHVMDREIYEYSFDDIVGLADSVQCKSGTDPYRTHYSSYCSTRSIPKKIW